MSLNKRQKLAVRIVGILAIISLLVTALVPMMSIFMEQPAA